MDEEALEKINPPPLNWYKYSPIGRGCQTGQANKNRGPEDPRHEPERVPSMGLKYPIKPQQKDDHFSKAKTPPAFSIKEFGI